MTRRTYIDTQLAVGFLLLLLLLLSFGIYAVRKSATLADLTDKIYEHPFTVGTNVRDIRGGIIAIHRDMKDVATAKNKDNLEKSLLIVKKREAEILERFAIVEEKFLGDKNRITILREEFLDWRPIRAEVVEHARAGRTDEAVAITQGKGANYVEMLNRNVQGLVVFAHGKATAFHDAAQKEAYESIWWLGILLSGTIIASFLIAVFLTHNMAYRRQQTERIQKNEENLAITLRSIGDAVIVTDTAGRIQRMNTVAEDLTGWPLAEAEGKDLSEVFRIFNEESRATVEDPVTKVLREGNIVGLANHTLLLSRDGIERPIADSAAPIRAGEKEDILGVVMVFRDQSAERAAERQIRHLNLVLRSIRNVNQLITHEKNPKTLLNKACLCLTQTRGYNCVWIVTMDRSGNVSLAAESGIGETFDAFARSFESGEELPTCAQNALMCENVLLMGNVSEECKECPLHGTEGECEGLTVAMRHENRVYGIICAQVTKNIDPSTEERELFAEVASDIAYALHSMEQERERKIAESDLENQKALLDLTGRMAKVGGWELDVATGEGTWTPEVARIHDMDPREKINISLGLSVYEEEDRHKIEATIDEAVKNGKPFELELEMASAKGVRKWVRISGRPVLEDGKTVRLVGTFQDITERRQIEMRLRQSEKMDAIGQLAGGIAHDFNNQLAGIMGYADMLVGRIEDKKLADYAEKILISTRRASDLTGQLLAFSRKGKFLSTPTDLHATVAEVVSFLKHSIDKRIEVKQILSANPSTVLGDPSQLQNAILNLALNARDAMPEGGKLTFSSNITMLTQKAFDFNLAEGRYIELSVSDTGCGIPKEAQKHIFEPFFTTKEQGQGTGLGLASVFGTVKNHKGAITVYSEVGKGTTFKLYFPVMDDVEFLRPTEIAKTPAAVPNARILIIDDEESVAGLVTEMLRDIGYNVIPFTSPEKALEYYKQSFKHIDLVILDMIMPHMNGRELFIAMRNINPEIRALLSSGYSIDGEAQVILDEGVLGFIQKPYRIGELMESVAKVLYKQG